MREITLTEIAEAVSGRILSGTGSEKVSCICTDSRKAKNGDLFVPIIGEVHDAHKFIPQVIEKGCRAVLVSREEAVPKDAAVVQVKDTTRALQDLAAWYLETLHLKKIAVTGSVGKTSTRDMVCAILKEKFVTGATAGNFNSEIGVPLTIFTFDDTMEAAVLEVGMDHFGEIHRTVDIIRPDIGIITNVGISHIENLGSREGILKAKMEITDFFGPENTLVVNCSNDMLASLNPENAGPYQLVTAGEEPEAEFAVSDVNDLGENGIVYKLRTEGKEYDISLAVPGAHNALNSALAIAACSRFGITVEEAQRGLSKIELTGKRLSIRNAGGIKVIDDTYNAAPDSMKSAIQTLMRIEGGRKIAVLADMNELGEQSSDHHKDVGRYAAEQKVQILITVGEKAADIAAGAETSENSPQILSFLTKDEFYSIIPGLFQKGDVILVKGSRGMEMEQAVEKILKEQE